MKHDFTVKQGALDRRGGLPQGRLAPKFPESGRGDREAVGTAAVLGGPSTSPLDAPLTAVLAADSRLHGLKCSEPRETP